MLVWYSAGPVATVVNAVTFLLSATTLAATAEVGKRVFRRDLYLNGRTPLEGWMQQYTTIEAGCEAIRALRNKLRLRFAVVLLYFVIAIQVGVLALISPLGVQPATERNIHANYRQAGMGLCLSKELAPRDPTYMAAKALEIAAKYAKAGGNLLQPSNSVGNDDESIPIFSDKATVPGKFVNETMRKGELNLTISINDFGVISYGLDTELLFGKDAVVYGNEEEYIRPMVEKIRPFILQGPIVVTLYDSFFEKGDVQRIAFCYGEEIVIPENDTERVFNFPCDTHGIALESPLGKELIKVDPDKIWMFMYRVGLEANEQNLSFIARAVIQSRLLTHILNDEERCGADEIRYFVPTRIKPVTLGSIIALLLTTCLVLVVLTFYIVLTRNSIDWNSNTYRLINLITRRQEKLAADCTELGGRSWVYALIIKTDEQGYRAHLTVGEEQAAEDFGLARRKPKWLVADSSGYVHN